MREETFSRVESLINSAPIPLYPGHAAEAVATRPTLGPLERVKT